MTREDIDRVLAGLAKDGRTAALAEIVADQERRLRALEQPLEAREAAWLSYAQARADASEGPAQTAAEIEENEAAVQVARERLIALGVKVPR